MFTALSPVTRVTINGTHAFISILSIHTRVIGASPDEKVVMKKKGQPRYNVWILIRRKEQSKRVAMASVASGSAFLQQLHVVSYEYICKLFFSVVSQAINRKGHHALLQVTLLLMCQLKTKHGLGYLFFSF